MPRGRKSKRQASEKRRQARLEASGQALDQVTETAAEASAEAGVAAASKASAEALLKLAEAASTKAVLSVVAKAVAAADKAATATKGKAAAAAAASIAPGAVKKREATTGRKAEDVGKKITTPLDTASAGNFRKPQEEQRASTSSKSQKKKKACFFAFPIHANPDTLARKALVLEQFLIYKFKTKQVILKKDMLGIIGAEYEEHFNEILKKASVRIEVVFAVKVMEVDPVIHSYDLVSKIKLPNNGRVRPGQGLPKTGLLMNVLGIIFLKGNRVKEEDLWKYLGMMKVFAGRKHSVFGEPRKLITKDLVKFNYLEYRQIPNSDPPSFEFLWGPKAYAETSKRQVLEFLAKVNDTEPSVFLAQFEELWKEEEK